MPTTDVIKIESSVSLGLANDGICSGYVEKVEKNLYRFSSGSFRQIIKSDELDRIKKVASANPVKKETDKDKAKDQTK